MIDLHSHVLPGLDDGPATVAGSLAIATAAARGGTAVIAATPHVRRDFPTSPDQMETQLALVREAVGAAGIDLQVVPGGELDIDWLSRLTVDDIRRFSLGNGPYVLVEFPYDGWPLTLASCVERLAESGFKTILAHPERNPDVQSAPYRLEGLVSYGVLVQLTAGSLCGHFGRTARETAFRLLDAGLAHVVASDVHRAAGGRGGLEEAVGALKDSGLARWLTEDVPRAALAGDVSVALPRPRPQPRRSRFFRR